MGQQYGVPSLVHALTPKLLPALTSASHAHIGLWLLLRHGPAGDTRDASLLRSAARKLAADPTGRLSSFAGMDIRGRKPSPKSAGQIEREIFARLADPPKADRPSISGIRGLMEAAESTGNADRYFGDLIRSELSEEQMDAAFRAIMRVSAHAMLQDDEDNAKFGWSHCFTLPQADCGLSSLGIDRKLGLATAMVWITAYRTILSDRALDFDYRPEPATASLREALHSASDVAAAKLCALWIRETPRQKIPDRFLDGRDTPA